MDEDMSPVVKPGQSCGKDREEEGLGVYWEAVTSSGIKRWEVAQFRRNCIVMRLRSQTWL